MAALAPAALQHFFPEGAPQEACPVQPRRAAALIAPRCNLSGGRVLLLRRCSRCGQRLHDFDLVDKAFCLRLGGWLQRAGELTGARRALVVERSCRTAGALYCESFGSWES